MMVIQNEYIMTELGGIPVEWEIKELSSVTKIVMGQSPDSSSYNNLGEGLPFYQGKSEFGRKYPVTVKWCSKPIKIAEKDDILFSVRAPVGKVNICQETSCIGRGLGAIRYIKNKTDHWFLYYTLIHSNSRFNNISQGSTFTAINGEELMHFNIVLPPLKEQQKIAEILSTIDEQIEQTEKLIEKTKELKKGLMQELLTKGIGHNVFKESELGEIPVEWTIKSLAEISNDLTIGLVTTMTTNYINIGVPLIRNSDIKEGFVRTEKMINLSYDFANSYKHKMLKKGDIVTVHTGDIGTSAVINDNLIGALGFAILQTTVQDNVSPEWLMSFFNSQIAKKQFYNFSTGDGRNNLNLKDFVKTRIIVPNSLNEQKQIATIIASVDENIKGYEKEKAKYEELKKGLMQQLLTGKIRVKVD